MLSINLGFVALPVSPALLIISAVIGVIVTLITAKKNDTSAYSSLLMLLLAGFLLGRVVYIVQFFDSFDSAWEMFDIREGGINFTAALIAFTLVLLLQLKQKKRKKQRQPLLYGLLTMAGTYAVFAIVIGMARSHTAIPDSYFMQLNGQQVKIRDISQQQPIVMNLWASSCEPCQRELPLFAQAHLRFSNVTFISLNQRESNQTVQQFLQREGLNLQHVLLDSKAEIATNKGLFSLPVTLFYNAEGELVYNHSGEISAAIIQQRIEQHF
jgi:thiol-disulfide isomerase/thioredoxin